MRLLLVLIPAFVVTVGQFHLAYPGPRTGPGAAATRTPIGKNVPRTNGGAKPKEQKEPEMGEAPRSINPSSEEWEALAKLVLANALAAKLYSEAAWNDAHTNQLYIEMLRREVTIAQRRWANYVFRQRRRQFVFDQFKEMQDDPRNRFARLNNEETHSGILSGMTINRFVGLISETSVGSVNVPAAVQNGRLEDEQLGYLEITQKTGLFRKFFPDISVLKEFGRWPSALRDKAYDKWRGECVELIGNLERLDEKSGKSDDEERQQQACAAELHRRIRDMEQMLFKGERVANLQGGPDSGGGNPEARQCAEARVFLVAKSSALYELQTAVPGEYLKISFRRYYGPSGNKLSDLIAFLVLNDIKLDRAILIEQKQFYEKLHDALVDYTMHTLLERIKRSTLLTDKRQESSPPASPAATPGGAASTLTASPWK